MSQFDKLPLLTYLGLPADHIPSPENDPINFLSQNISNLPPHLSSQFTYITTPKQRTAILTIRNRRLYYASSNPLELQLEAAKLTWPHLWEGSGSRVIQQADGEEAWVQSSFLKGAKQHVGKLGNLLAEYEQEREAERVRALRRAGIVNDEFVPEEDSDSDEDLSATAEVETEDEKQRQFERTVRERFIYGLLDGMDYDKVDWDESLEDDRDTEDRWFNEDD